MNANCLDNPCEGCPIARSRLSEEDKTSVAASAEVIIDEQRVDVSMPLYSIRRIIDSALDDRLQDDQDASIIAFHAITHKLVNNCN